MRARFGQARRGLSSGRGTWPSRHRLTNAPWRARFGLRRSGRWPLLPLSLPPHPTAVGNRPRHCSHKWGRTNHRRKRDMELRNEMPQREDPELQLDEAQALLQPHLGHGSRLDHPHLLKDGARCRVIRCRWTAPGQPVRSVILERVKEDVEALTFIAEWASLVFLTALPAARQIAPRFLAGDIS